MKIALWGSYGMLKFPLGFDVRQKNDIKLRESLAEYLENNFKSVEDISKYSGIGVLDEAIEESIHKCVALTTDNGHVRYYVNNGEYIGYWYIKEIDTSKLWWLDTYDGAEDIQYFEVMENNQLHEIN